MVFGDSCVVCRAGSVGTRGWGSGVDRRRQARDLQPIVMFYDLRVFRDYILSGRFFFFAFAVVGTFASFAFAAYASFVFAEYPAFAFVCFAYAAFVYFALKGRGWSGFGEQYARDSITRCRKERVADIGGGRSGAKGCGRGHRPKEQGSEHKQPQEKPPSEGLLRL